MERYRKTLEKCLKGTYVFVGVVNDVVFDRCYVTNITVMKTDGTVIGKVDHLLTNVKPFKKRKAYGKLCRFTGTIYEYTRLDGSKDYGVRVNKVKVLKDQK